MIRRLSLSCCLVAVALLSGCATLPSPQDQGSSGGQIGYVSAQLPAMSSVKPSAGLPQRPLTAVTGMSSPRTASTEAVIQAITQLGTAYDWGGISADKGFDCSGLTYYVYREASIVIPRTARGQYRATRHVSRKRLRPGDLVFFRLHGRWVDHVGIYIGNHRFIHAPRRGKHVSFARLNTSYWSRHFVAGGRIPGAHVIELANNP